MPIFRTPEEQADAISKLPESAMGFQLLDLSLEQWSDGYLFLALNSRFLIPANSLDELLRELQDLRGVTAEWLAESPDVSEVEVRGVDEEIGSIGIIKSWGPRLAVSLFEEEMRGRHGPQDIVRTQPLAGIPAPGGPRAYFRFSAFPNDRRVLADGSFRGGTYATTASDLRMVPSGFAAVARYALPNPMTAKYVYTLVTDAVPDKVGATVPNFGQAGGGVEVLFKKQVRPSPGRPWTVPDE